MSRRYTADEMRDMALVEESYGWDVVAKMLRQAADEMEREERENGVCHDHRHWYELCDHIEKAYKFMVEGLNGGIVERDQYIENLTDENERLKAALKSEGKK